MFGMAYTETVYKIVYKPNKYELIVTGEIPMRF